MISAENIVFSVGDTAIIDEATISLPEGSCTAVAGFSGSGKSIFLKLLAGILHPTSGKVSFQGKDLGEMTEDENLAFRKTMGFVFQDGALWENKSVFQNLELPLRFHHPEISANDAQERIESELRSYGLEHERNSRPAVLSMGEMKMVSFLRAVLLDPQLLFLDEPDTSLDSRSLALMKGRIQAMLRTGATVMLITNRAEWISELSTHLAIVHDRKLLAFGPTQDLVKNPPPGSESILASLSGLAGFYSDDILNLVEGENF